VSSHGSQASLIFPYVIPMLPDIFKMSELNDSSELQTYSSAVLYVLSAVTPVPEFVDVILQRFVAAIKSSTVRLWLSSRASCSFHPVLAHSPPCTTFAGRILLSQSHGDIRCECLSDHGPHAQLPFRRQRRGTGNGIKRAFRNRQSITASEYHTLEGNVMPSRILCRVLM